MRRAAFEWGLDGLRHVAPEAEVVVIVDVLSFSTAVDVAVGRGAAVVPSPSDHRSGAVMAEEPGALVAVGRDEADDDHPWSLSPASLRSLPPGSRLVLPSPNGSALAAEAVELGLGGRCGTVLAGCLRNATAVAAAVRRAGDRVAIVAAGERWPTGGLRPAVEDMLGSGAVLAALATADMTPEARAAQAAFASLGTDLAHALQDCTSGRELAAAGFGADVEVAAELDVSRAVPMLAHGAFMAAPAPR